MTSQNETLLAGEFLGFQANLQGVTGWKGFTWIKDWAGFL